MRLAPDGDRAALAEWRLLAFGVLESGQVALRNAIGRAAPSRPLMGGQDWVTDTDGAQFGGQVLGYIRVVTITPDPFPPIEPEPGPDPIPDRPPMPEPHPEPVPQI